MMDIISYANTTLHVWLSKMEIDSPRYLLFVFFIFILGLLAKTLEGGGGGAITDLDTVHMALRQHELAPTETD